MPLQPHCIMAVLLAIGVSGALAVGESHAVPAAGTTTTVSSGAVSAIVTTTGGSLVSLSTSTTAHDGQVSTCIQIVVDDLFGEFCEEAPHLTPQACAGLEEGCVQLGGEVRETAEDKLCMF